MNKNYYDLYINSVFNLAETIVIKSEDTASTINSFIRAVYGQSSVDEQDLTSWKYYKNICGQYHNTDTMMRITSLDTLQSIDFTIENLTASNSTRKAYEYGSRNYNELVSLYPDQEMLILGILYPANMTKAIVAADGAIICYPKQFVEDNEASLIKNIQVWIDKFKIRWNSVQFGVSDDLYTTTYLGLVYVNLVPLIINLRLKACKTNEVHSFHVRQYLASHGMLDVYLDVMTRRQALFFYRNIAYIERNSGKREVFELLVENVMTQRNLPLAEYNMKHDVSLLPDELYARINFDKKSINPSINSTDRNRYSFNDLLDKQVNVELGNKDYIEKEKDAIKVKLHHSLSSVLKTKVLDSSTIDYTDDTPYTFYETTLNLWMLMSSRDMYNVFVSFKNPKTGAVNSIQTKDAFAYFFYVFTRALGTTPIVIPSLLANRVVRIPTPSVEDILSVADTKYVTTADAQTLLSFMPQVTTVISVEDFHTLSTELYNAAQNQLKFTATAEHDYKRVLFKNMMIRNYCDTFCNFASSGTKYSQWLVEKNLPVDEFSQTEYLDIYVQLFEAVTGSKFDNTTQLKALQKAMISLLKQLSSYSIQFIYETLGSNFKVLEHSVVRIGDRKADVSADVKLSDLAVIFSNINANVSTINQIDTNSPLVSLYIKSAAVNSVHFELTTKPFVDNKTFEQTKLVSLGNLSIETSYVDGRETGSKIIGYEVVKRLTKEQVVDLYCNVAKNESFKIDITSIITDTNLSGFINTEINNSTIESFSYNDLTLRTSTFIDDKVV